MTRTGRRDLVAVVVVLLLGGSLIAERIATPADDRPVDNLVEVDCPGDTVESDGPQFACWLARTVTDEAGQ